MQRSIMISSVIYTPAASQAQSNSTFSPSKSPLFQIVFAKVLVIVMSFLLGDLMPQLPAAIIVSSLAALEFWITKNLGRMYLHASWSVDTTGE